MPRQVENNCISKGPHTSHFYLSNFFTSVGGFLSLPSNPRAHQYKRFKIIQPIIYTDKLIGMFQKVRLNAYQLTIADLNMDEGTNQIT